MVTVRLFEVVVRNFKGLEEVSFSIPETDPELPGSGEFLSIVGENNVGKSSILQALQLALPSTDISKPGVEYFPERDASKGPIEVELVFDHISDEERKKQGIRTHVYDGKFRLKKVWDSPGTGPKYKAYQPNRSFPDWFSSKQKRHTFIDEGGDEAERIVEIYEDRHGDLDGIRKPIRSKLRAIAVEEDAGFVEEDSPDWQENPGGFKSNVDSLLPEVIKIPAIKDPSEEVETSRKTSSIGHIINRIFDDHLQEKDVIQELKETGEEVKNLFEGEEKDDTIEAAEKRITNKIRRMIDLEASIDFNPPDVTSNLAGRTSLQVIHEGVKTSPEHQGHGAQRALILSLLECLAEDRIDAEENDAYRKPLLLMIEEPEIYMHPQMLRRMRDVLLDIAKSEKAQVICTTHSPVFLDLADRHEGILILQKNDSEIDYVQRNEDLFPEDTVEDKRRRLRMILNFDPTVNEVFFSRRVCLVEGDTEIAAVEAIANRLSDDGKIEWEKYLDKRRLVTIVNCRGKWTINAFQRVLNGFNIDYFVVHDTDDKEEDEGANDRIKELHPSPNKILTHDPNLEEEFFGEDPSGRKPWNATKKFQELAEIPDSAIEFFEHVIGEKIENLTS